LQFGNCVLNDVGQTGFGTHGHANMEIITIPLEGGLMHKDSMGMKALFVLAMQVMSAGSGVEHSEMNASATDHAKHCNYGFS
jgi:redox-sensitive bicupin YhaK (pirin superfamily)